MENALSLLSTDGVVAGGVGLLVYLGLLIYVLREQYRERAQERDRWLRWMVLCAAKGELWDWRYMVPLSVRCYVSERLREPWDKVCHRLIYVAATFPVLAGESALLGMDLEEFYTVINRRAVTRMPPPDEIERRQTDGKRGGRSTTHAGTARGR